MDTTLESAPKAKPYKGADFYRAEDQHIFFGRGAEANNLCALILSRRLTLLHAASGAGKTSLLHALVMSALEDRGLLCVRTVPHNDPVAALKAATLFRVLPDPQLEAEAIVRTLKICRPFLDGPAREDPKQATLKELVTALNQRVPRDDDGFLLARSPLRGELVLPNGKTVASDQVTPFFTRFLYSANGPTLLARQVHAYSQFVSAPPWQSTNADSLTTELATCPAEKLIAFFRRPEVLAIHRETIAFVLASNSELSLRPFFQRLCTSWGAVIEAFGIVLILDQFEEVFTRFIDQRFRGLAKDGTLPDWTLRPLFFRDLATLLGPEAPTASGASEAVLPVRVLISMRDDFIADIDQLERETGTIPQESRYHLSLLHKAACAEVIRGPAQTFGYDYAPDLLDALLEQLPAEHDLIEPGHLQIVCERLWDEFGKEMRRHRSGVGQEASELYTKLPAIDRKSLTDLDGVDGILARHFTQFLESFPDRLDRIEILDMLEPLVTLGLRRNIVAEGEILGAHLSNRAFREPLLEALRGAKIVRVEPRLSGSFVEITHEFLIHPVMDAVRTYQRDDRLWRDLRTALARLEQIERRGFRSIAADRLSPREFDALTSYRERIDPAETRAWIAELMLRTAIRLGRSPEQWQSWREQLDRSSNRIESVVATGTLAERVTRSAWLDHLEFEALLAGDRPSACGRDTARFLLEGAVRNADPAAVRRLMGWLLEDSREHRD